MSSIGSITGINTVLFDLDGTLINTNALIFASLHHTYMTHTGSVPETKKLIEFFGRPLPEHFAHFGPDECERMVRTYRAFNIERHDTLVGMYEGSTECLCRLRSSGISVGVVTSKGRSIAERGLGLIGGVECFDVTVCTEDTIRHKPDPEPIITAMARLGKQPGECVMVGDAPADMASGAAAGVFTIAVGWTEFARDALLEAGAKEFVESFDGLGDRLLAMRGM